MNLTIEQALRLGVAAHRKGKLQEAERLYRVILSSQSKHPDANHNLGVLAVSVGKVLSPTSFAIALKANPNVEQFWISYIDALINSNNMTKLDNFSSGQKTRGDRKGIKFFKGKALPKNKNRGNTDISPNQELLNKLLEYYERAV